MMGNEVLVYLETGEREFRSRVDPRTAARAGQQLEVAFDIDRIHVFGAETRAAIGLPAATIAFAVTISVSVSVTARPGGRRRRTSVRTVAGGGPRSSSFPL